MPAIKKAIAAKSRGHLALVKTVPTPIGHRANTLDLGRGVAVLAMVLFHLLFDLSVFSKKDYALVEALPEWFWRFIPGSIGCAFFLALGASARLKYISLAASGKQRSYLWQRALFLGIVAIGITCATALFTPQVAIYFGVIHCMAVSTALLIPFLAYPKHCLLASIFFVTLGFGLSFYRFPFRSLFWLGLPPEDPIVSGDNYAVLPWFGVALFGVYLVSRFPRHFELSPPTKTGMLSPLSWLGRHSLLVYLAHQPLLLPAIYFIDHVV